MTTRRVHKDAPQNPSTRPTSSIQMGEPSPQLVMSPVQLQTPESMETTSSRPSLSRRGSSRTSLPNGPEQDSNQSIPQAKVFTKPKPGRVVKNARAAKKTQAAADMNVAKHTPSRKQAQAGKNAQAAINARVAQDAQAVTHTQAVLEAQAAENAQLGKDAQLSDDIQAAFGTQAALDPQAVIDAVVDWIKRFPTHHDILLIDGETVCQQTIILAEEGHGPEHHFALWMMGKPSNVDKSDRVWDYNNKKVVTDVIQEKGIGVAGRIEGEVRLRGMWVMVEEVEKSEPVGTPRGDNIGY